MLVLEEGTDCRRETASLFLPLLIINTSRMEEEGEKREGGIGISWRFMYVSLFLLRVLYSFLMCDFSDKTVLIRAIRKLHHLEPHTVDAQQ